MAINFSFIRNHLIGRSEVILSFSLRESTSKKKERERENPTEVAKLRDNTHRKRNDFELGFYSLVTFLDKNLRIWLYAKMLI